jgi:hypothetical protein
MFSYLILGHEEKLAASAKLAGKADILRTIDMVEDVSAKAEKTSGRKKTPPSGTQKSSGKEKSKADMIKELGRRPSQETISLYTRKNSQTERGSESPEKRLSEERKSPSVERDTLPTASKQFMMDRRSMDVPTDILNTIQEERNRSPLNAESTDGRKDSSESVSSLSNQNMTVGQRLADRRKFPFNRYI